MVFDTRRERAERAMGRREKTLSSSVLDGKGAAAWDGITEDRGDR